MKKKSLEEVKHDAENTALELVQETHSQKTKDEVLLSFGAIGGMRVVSRFIGVSTISILREIRDEKKYKVFGYANFEDFLEKDALAIQYAGISYRTFNQLEKQLEAEGDELYELLNNFKIPISTRRILTSNGETQISLDGDKLLVGEEEISLDSPQIKQVIKELANGTKQLAEQQEKSEKTIEKLNSQVTTGAKEFDELRRSLNALQEGSDFDRAYSHLLSSFVKFNNQISQLTPEEISQKGETCLETIWTLLEETRKRLGSNRNFHDPKAVAGISDLGKKVFAENDDFGDEFEN